MLPNLKDKHLILASASPRRQSLLKGLNVDFEIRVKSTDEDFPTNLKAQEIPLYLAQVKAKAFEFELQKNEILITCDTVVWVNNQVLNKPADRKEAIEMIQLLAGKMHQVYTAVAITTSDNQTLFYDETKVYFNTLSQSEIEYYIDTCQPYDKAGSYGVQEWLGYVGIKKIEGCFYNVMGLPLQKLYQHLREL